MKNNFSPVTDKNTLEELVARSQTEPVVLFKHSTSCGISASAYKELESLGGKVNLIEIQRSPLISEEVERLTGLRHESPQVIILRRGKRVWDASHRQITLSAVESAVRGSA
jgi:bacillithiol system protein YtxJ